MEKAGVGGSGWGRYKVLAGVRGGEDGGWNGKLRLNIGTAHGGTRVGAVNIFFFFFFFLCDVSFL